MPNRIGVFLQLGTHFVLSDDRYVDLSDAAQSLWVTLEAMAVENRKEFLPPEVTAKTLARRRARSVADIEKALEELQAGPRPLIYVVSDNRWARIRVVGVRKHHGERFAWREESNEVDSWNNAFANDETSPLNPQDFAAVHITGRPRLERPPEQEKRPFTTGNEGERQEKTVTDVDVEVKDVRSKIQTRRSSTASAVKQPSCHTTAGLDKQSENHINGNTWHVDPAIHQLADGLLIDWPSPGRDKVESQLRANLARGSPFHVLATVRDISLKFRGERKCAGKKILHPWLALAGRFKKSEYSVSDTDLAWCKEQVEFTQSRGPPAQRGGEPESVGEILGGQVENGQG